MTFMNDNLWDNLSHDKKENPSMSTGTELAEMSPSEMITYDIQNEQLVHNETDALKTSLIFCEQIVTAAYKVAEYVPDLSNDQHATFWKQKVIPNLVQSLVQDVRARSIIVGALSAIRDLSITIQKAGSNVKETKGSSKAIEIAQKNIPNALKTIERYIEQASTLENTAIETFASQTQTLFEIIGPEAVKFVDQKAEIEGHLKKLYDEQQKLFAELGQKQGEIQRINHMMNATQSQLSSATQTLEDTKRRTEALNQLNMQVEETIKSIPVSTPQTVTSTTHNRHGWWFWRRSSSSTTTHTVMVQNANREAEKNYYDSIVLSRMARIRENQNDEAAKQRVMNDLNVCLAEHKSNGDKAMTELEQYRKAFPEKIKCLQDQIDHLHKRIEEIDKKEVTIGNMVGHQGNTLIQCLVEVRTFAKTIKGGASAYAPLVSILNGIKAMVENDVELLSSSRPSDIFLAGNHLLKQVQFLSSYSSAARAVLQASAQYNSLANAIEFKTRKVNENS